MIDASLPIGGQLDAVAGEPTGIEKIPMPLHGHAGAPLTARVIALIDGGSGSSAESSAIALRAAFCAPLTGAPSRGCVDWGNVINCPLPGTGTKWCIPTHGTRDAGGPYDLVGITPDVVLEAPGMAAIDAAQAAPEN